MLSTRLHDHLQATDLLPPQSKLVVAVSGGVDSVALLNMLHELQDFYGWQMVVAHLDHNARPSSAHDAQFVAGLAESYNMPFYLEKLSKDNATTEAAWRAARYSFLERLREELNYHTIVTAHHGDDRIETAVFNSIRGADREGITALKAKRGNVSRPLLPFSKAEIITYANLKELPFITDETNTDIGFSRNYVREELLPLGSTMYRNFRHSFHTVLNHLEDLNKKISLRLHNVVTDLTLSSSTESVELAKEGFRNLPDTIALNVIALLAKQLSPGIGLSQSNLRQALGFWQTGKSGSSKNLKAGLQLSIGYDTVRIAYHTDETPLTSEETARLLTDSSPYQNKHFTIQMTGSIAQGDDSVILKPAKYYVRLRQSGDRIAPIGLQGSKKLQDIFVDKKIPRELRGHWPIIVNSRNEVVWVPFIATSRNHSVDSKSGIKIVCKKN